MYTNFFGLHKPPFSLTPDPGFLFLPPKHREALAGLTYAVLKRKGFVVLTGDAGTGKTTLINSILNHLPAGRIESSIILNPTLTASEFLEAVLLDFDIADVPASKAQRLWKLQEFLTQTYLQNNLAVLIVDEAHKLSLEILEEIRLLGNFESPTDKFLQIILLGQPELDDLLSRQDLRQLRQRIALRLSINRLTDSEVGEYIRSRWITAGGTSAIPFTPEAVDGIVRWSQGIPRLVNSICDTTLLMAFGNESHSVTMSEIRAAAACLALEDGRAASAGQISPVHASGHLHTFTAAAPERKYPAAKLAPVEVPLPAPIAPAAKQDAYAAATAEESVSNGNPSFLRRMADKLGFSY